MDKILIKTNQYIHYNILVCDDTTDKYCDIGLVIDDNVFIVIFMEGTICGFDSR